MNVEESTATLVHRLKAGDEQAGDLLFARCLPLLRRWARGRLPPAARSLMDTDDVVQMSLMKTLRRIDHYEPQQPGSFMAYLRTVLMNAVRDEIRKAGRQPDLTDRLDEQSGREVSPLRRLVTNESLTHYEKGLATLSPRQRDAVILRLEFGMTYPEIAAEIDSETAGAARALVSRGLLRLAAGMP